MVKSPKVSPKERKGVIVDSVNLSANQQSNLDTLSKKHQGISEYRQYDNGSVGVFFNDGKFRFVTGSKRLTPRASGSSVSYPKLSPRAAKIAFGKYYKKKSYTKPSARKAAITRDLCSDNKPIVNDSRYRRSPHRYNYPGLDDGSKCPTGNVHKKRAVKADPTFHKRMTEAKALKAQKGGAEQRPVSLKTAIRLLRNYYQEKYSQ